MTSVILRNIPPHCQEEELRRALLIYGTPMSVSIAQNMNQATVVMRNPHEARNLINQRCIHFFGHSVMVEPLHYSAGGGPGSGAGAGVMAGMMPPHNTTTRIKVIVEQCSYPVTKEVLMQVFGIIATPSNVFCGRSGQTTTGWVEYPDAATAERVVQQLNKNSIYPECCYMTLMIDHNASAAGSMGKCGPPSVQYTPHQPQPQHHHQHQQHQHQPPPSQPMPFGHTNYGAMPGALPQRGGMGRGRGRGAMGGRGGHAAPYNAPMPPHQQYPGSPYGAAQADAVVIVSNIPETVALHDLWVLLEVYGNVSTLRRQFSSKTTVVAHFQNVHDARLAVQNLQNCPFHDSTLSLKHFAGYVDRVGRTEWNTGPATDPATHAVLFSVGYHHRTKPSAAFNPTGRVRPDKNLFISNLTAGITDDEVKGVFSDAGFELESYFRKNSSVAIVSLGDLQSAVHALIAVHSQQLKERFLRVTFSHFPPGPRAENEKDGLCAEDKNDEIGDDANEEGEVNGEVNADDNIEQSSL